MILSRLFIVTAILASLTAQLMACGPIDIGSRLELLLDNYLIESMENLEFQLHPPQAKECVLVFDKPWESVPYCDYVTVFKDDKLYRMYYASHLDAPRNYKGENQWTCYAQSEDGIHWTKPSLGMIEFDGSTENNIVMHGWAGHNFAPFLDTRPGVPDAEKYKAVGGHPLPELFVSADAIRWRKVGEIRIPSRYDSQNVIFWDTIQKQYVFYYRFIEGSLRHIARSTSRDFLDWSEGRPIELDGAPKEQLYTNATIPYFRAPHLYLSFPMRFVTTRKPLVSVYRDGVCDAVFMFSRDGVHFSRRYVEAFMRPGPDPKNWTKHSMMIAWGILPTSEEEMSFYVSQHSLTDTNHLIRAVLRTDGFVSVRGSFRGGQFITRPLVFSGDKLVINAETGAAGGIRVEIQAADGKPMEGYRLEDSQEFYGDKIAHTVNWKNGANISRLADVPVRLRFVMKDADLYSIRFRP